VSNDKGKSGSQSSTGRRSAVRRKLSYPSRVREAVRGGSDRVLGVDLGWSAAFIIVSMFLLGSQRCAVSYPKLEAGETAEHDVFVHTDIQVIDHQATEERREEARTAVPEVFVYDVRPMRRHIDELAAIFVTGREAMETAEGDPLGEARAVLERLAGPALDVLVEQQFSTDLEAKLTAPLQEVMGQWVIGNKATLERLPSVYLVTIPGEQGRTLTDYSSIIELSQAREQVRDAIRRSLELPAEEEAFLAELGESFVEANLANVPARTDVRRKAAADEVLPVLLKIPAGTQLVAAGERVSEETLARLNAAREETQGTVGLLEFLGLLIVVSMLAFFLHRYTRHHQRHFKKVKQLHALLVLVILCMALLAQAMLWLARGLVDNLGFPFNEVEVYSYLIPVGAGAILVALLSNGRIAMVYSAFVTVLFGALAGWDFYMALWSLLVQWAGVYAISTYRERAALLRAGLVVGGAGAAVAVAMEVLNGTLEPLPRSMYGMGLAFLGGAVGVGLLVSFALPLFEGVFNVLTDIRLLELSNVNNPLLSQLAVKAPGSYNHSLVVGTLAEEGAKAIGANSLLCKVAAFYHDIGKIRKPEYYVENMLGVNPHDRLSPSMSALIIAAHVKDGIQLAREAGLPQQIVDIIPQHHGTRLMTYFYDKAQKTSDPSLSPVKDEDFRYPGPKPQTKEAAIFMLADAVEAAARTVEDPTANRLREVIQKITNSIVLDKQFQECDLTFSDLNRIQEAFLRTLVSFHHQRVEYPGFDFKKPKGGARKEAPEESASAPAASSTESGDAESPRAAADGGGRPRRGS
jgi:putative nucleotidyltransferase with HDIG domain